MLNLIKCYVRDERGATVTEYAMLVVFVALALAVTAQTFSANVDALFGKIGTTLASITPSVSGSPSP
jgi:Flp pilus assembly pilin Flp